MANKCKIPLSETLCYIDNYIKEFGYGPTYQVIAIAKGVAKSTAKRYCDLLISAGALSRFENYARTVRVVSPYPLWFVDD